jgi:hypothetical protein
MKQEKMEPLDYLCKKEPSSKMDHKGKSKFVPVLNLSTTP